MAQAAGESLAQTVPRVLLLESNVQLAKQVVAALQGSYEVGVARNAQTAIIAADRARPDVVISELHVLDASISGFLHEFRSYAEWRTIPVVLYTFALHIPAPIKQLLMERFQVAAILHKSHVSAEGLRDYLAKLTTPVV